MKPLPLHVQEWEAAAMIAGSMTQKRVPFRMRWTPRGRPLPITTDRPFANAVAGALFWVAEPFTWWQGKGVWQAMEHVDYGHSPTCFTPKPAQVRRWDMKTGEAEQMSRNLSRMTVEVVGSIQKPVVEISDSDVVAEGLGFLAAPALRAAFLRRYRETYGEELGLWSLDCMVVQFRVIPKNIGAVVAEQVAA
ncbi:MAG TPA: hypothetical protein VHZ78_08710 [Rhizomicrobium sp.]|jgi:hypothetical protein|nr:hypothetical protein [Rhizomicrobium sp.]